MFSQQNQVQSTAITTKDGQAEFKLKPQQLIRHQDVSFIHVTQASMQNKII